MGAAGTAAGKVLTVAGANAVLAGTGMTLNANVIASGVLATIPVTVGAGATAGPNTVGLVNQLAASATGSAIALTTTSTTLTVISISSPKSWILHLPSPFTSPWGSHATAPTARQC